MISSLFLSILLIISAWTDWKEQRIYNKVLGPALLSAILLNVYQAGIGGLKASAIGMIVGLTLLIIPYFLGGIGAGDVKLLAVIGSIGGPEFVFYSFLYSALIGGCMSLIILFRKRVTQQVLLNLWLTMPVLKFQRTDDLNYEARINNTFPYGIAIASGTMIALLSIGLSI